MHVESRRHVRGCAPEEKASPTDEAEALDDVVLQRVLFACGKRGVDDMREVGLERISTETSLVSGAPHLQADVKEPDESERLVDDSVANWRVDAVSDEKILDALQQLHGKKEKDAGRKVGILRVCVNPVRYEAAFHMSTTPKCNNLDFKLKNGVRTGRGPQSRRTLVG